MTTISQNYPYLVIDMDYDRECDTPEAPQDLETAVKAALRLSRSPGLLRAPLGILHVAENDYKAIVLGGNVWITTYIDEGLVESGEVFRLWQGDLSGAVAQEEEERKPLAFDLERVPPAAFILFARLRDALEKGVPLAHYDANAVDAGAASIRIIVKIAEEYKSVAETTGTPYVLRPSVLQKVSRLTDQEWMLLTCAAAVQGVRPLQAADFLNNFFSEKEGEEA